ncbi:MAG: xanthine dehydrogenase family protein subunit M [bacterium]|nr:xanthine dehydrogenase family protein subunit M [bacterium]
MSKFDYFKPKSLSETFELYEKFPEAMIIAGGTDLMVKIRTGAVKPTVLISLNGIPELSGIEIGETVRIGAATTFTEVIANPGLYRVLPLLRQTASAIAGRQVRNTATVGGNLCNCSPCADMALSLLVLEGRAILQSGAGSREVPLTDLFIGPGQNSLQRGEILTAVVLDKSSSRARSTFIKKTRVKMDMSIASVAVLLEIHDDTFQKACFAAGSVAPVPMRLKSVEKLFIDKKFSEDLVTAAGEAAMSAISPITDIRAGAEYRRRIIGVYIKRAIRQLIAGN